MLVRICFIFSIKLKNPVNNKRFLTSPCPLQRGIARTYPPLEGAGGGLINIAF
jgi:hypothetical protein